MRHFKNHFNQITVICKISGSNFKSAESQSIAAAHKIRFYVFSIFLFHTLKTICSFENTFIKSLLRPLSKCAKTFSTFAQLSHTVLHLRNFLLIW